MIDAAIVGLGWWGRTLVESLAAGSDSIRFTTLTTRTVSADVEEFAKQHNLRIADNYQSVLDDPKVHAVVLATPPSGHAQQVIAAAAAGKHVFCEKPFTYSKSEAVAAVNSITDAGLTIGVGYNRRFHPEMIKLRKRIRSGGLGIVQHIECSMTFPNALFLQPTAWRANQLEAPCGGLAPMGVHAIDAMIDLCGELDHVYCLSFARTLQGGPDDTTSMLFRMKAGMSGYLGTITTTGPGFSIQVFGSKGWLRLEGATHVAGASSEARRTHQFGMCKWQPVNGPAEVWEAEKLDVTRASFEAFALAAQGGPPFPISPDEIVHCSSASEAVIQSSLSGKPEAVA